MTEQLTEREKMLTTMLTSVAQALKDLTNCAECGGLSFKIIGVREMYKPDAYEGLVVHFDTEDCNCKKQAQSVLNIIRNYEGEETVSETA